MVGDRPRFLLVTAFYPQFLAHLDQAHPEWVGLEYDRRLAALLDCGFNAVDAYRYELGRLGCAVDVGIVNADPLQAAWAREHGVQPDSSGDVHEWRRRVLAAQIAELKPDVLYVFEWSPLGDGFLREVKEHTRLVVGQIASPLKGDRSYGAYDLMVSSFAPLVDYFRANGTAAELLRLGFDRRVLDRLGPHTPKHDVTFVGGFAPSHDERIPWLERLIEELNIDVFGYGLDRVPPSSPIHARCRGEAWGWAMYEVLRQSRVTLNRHARIDVGRPDDRNHANNMRLYEATGVGTCLVTDHKHNLADLFEPGRELVSYADPDECVEVVRALLANEPRRAAIARAGQARTLAYHGYHQRMAELLEIVSARLERAPRRRRSAAWRSAAGSGA